MVDGSAERGRCRANADLDHLGIEVVDQARSRHFYETFLGFDEGPSTRYDDGTLIIRNAHGFSLALHPVQSAPRPAGFLHFGFGIDSPETVREIQKCIQAED